MSSEADVTAATAHLAEMSEDGAKLQNSTAPGCRHVCSFLCQDNEGPCAWDIAVLLSWTSDCNDLNH